MKNATTLLPLEAFRNVPLVELDAGDASHIKAGPMRFAIRHFTLEGIGHLVIMQGSAMLGLMKMDTVILAPTHRDAPLYSYDRIRAMGNDTLLVEYYDTFVDPALREGWMPEGTPSLSDIPDHDLGKHWYDGLKLPCSISKRAKGVGGRFDDFYVRSLSAYIQALIAAPEVDPARKRAKTAAYVDGLFENGGPSTDAFVKALGKEKAQALFYTVIFGLR